MTISNLPKRHNTIEEKERCQVKTMSVKTMTDLKHRKTQEYGGYAKNKNQRNIKPAEQDNQEEKNENMNRSNIRSDRTSRASESI